MEVSKSFLEHPLELICQQFARDVRSFCRILKHDIENLQDIKQLVRASGSGGANYIEAIESFATQNF